jgi:hypothetical protein
MGGQLIRYWFPHSKMAGKNIQRILGMSVKSQFLQTEKEKKAGNMREYMNYLFYGSTIYCLFEQRHAYFADML